MTLIQSIKKDKQMMQKIMIRIICLVVAGVCFSFLFQRSDAMAVDDGTRIITDNYGREITIPAKVKKIACMPGSSYEMVFMLGGKDQISEVRKDHRTAYPLANLTNPDLIHYSSTLTNINPKARINIEEFIKIAPDVVIYYNVTDALRKFEEASIPVYVYQPNKKSKDFDEAIEGEKKTMRSFAVLLGGGALEKAEKWCRYYDTKIEFIRSRTRDIPSDERPRVYIGNSWGRNALSTWAGATMTFTVNVCGGICVTKDITGAKFPEVNFEQILEWNPDVIIIDNHGRDPGRVIEKIYKDADWSVITAVKQKRVHRIPSGVFFLDKGSTRPVYLLWLAKKLTPKQFTDVDMVKEIRFYFREFYQFDLSVADAEHALRGWDANYEN